MTTQITSRFFGCLIALFLVSEAFTQQAEENTLVYARLKNGTVISGSIENSRPIEAVAVNSKVLNSFSRTFEPVSNLNWSKVGKDFLAVFTSGGKENRALFTKKGKMVYTISYGAEKDLSSENRKLVKSIYFDYSITSAIEVKEDNRTIWVIRLEDATNLIFVRIENGEMEETKHYQKSK